MIFFIVAISGVALIVLGAVIAGVFCNDKSGYSTYEHWKDGRYK